MDPIKEANVICNNRDKFKFKSGVCPSDKYYGDLATFKSALEYSCDSRKYDVDTKSKEIVSLVKLNCDDDNKCTCFNYKPPQ